MPKATLSLRLAREALSAHPTDHRGKTAGPHEATCTTAGRTAESTGGDSGLAWTGVMCTTHILVWHSQALHTNFFFQQAHTVGPQITSFRYNVEMPKEPNSRLYQLVCGKTGNIIHRFAYSSTTY